MRASKRRGIVVLVMMFGTLALSAQTTPLNPTVTVLIEPAGPVPTSCVDGEVPEAAQQRPALPARPQPAPARSEPAATQPVAVSGDLRSNLRDAHAAAVRRDRLAFDAAVAAAKTMAAGASAGDRTMAAGTLDVYEDVARLWDYQFNTPAGSFFDESVQGGSLLASLKEYPGYEAFVEPNTIRDASGTRYYPTRESIDFLIRVAGDRLTRGGAAPARVAETPREVSQPPRVEPQPPAKDPARTSAPSPSPVPLPVPPPVAAERKPPAASGAAVTKPVETRRSTASNRRRARPRKAAVTESAESSAPEPSRTGAAAASTPSKRAAAPPTPASSESAGTPAIEDPLFPQGVVMEPPPSEPATTTVEAPPPAGTVSAETVGTQAAENPVAPEKVAQPAKKRSVILPLVLILIGVGVLIILFRASS